MIFDSYKIKENNFFLTALNVLNLSLFLEMTAIHSEQQVFQEALSHPSRYNEHTHSIWFYFVLSICTNAFKYLYSPSFNIYKTEWLLIS